jgi:Zn-finger nucleic acid-binding protein
MDCPKCGGYLESKAYGPKIALERCHECFGLFVAPDVLMEMREEWMTEAFLDVGHPKVGKEYDKVGDIRCPACNVPMDKVVDPRQTHIWMESCPQCEKIFLDAGEFSDLKYETFMDKIKDLFRRRRPK